MAVFYVAGYLIEERRRWPITVLLPREDNVPNKFRILKERHVRMRKPYQSPGQDEKLILLYCPGRGLNSRPPARRSYKHGQGAKTIKKSRCAQVRAWSMDRKILSKLPTLLRHKLQSKMAHFAALDRAYVYTTIRNHYRTS